ncbi:MAG: ATP-binding cassette domain-containing protein [Thermodesulfobacteriota bacterium]
MTAPVRFIDASLPPLLDGASRDFEEESVTQVVTGGEAECALLAKAIAGLAPLAGGRILLLGEDPAALSRKDACALRSRTAIFHAGGGLISNLKVVENVTLPLLYHSDEDTEAVWEKAVASLERAGYRGNLFELPGRLTSLQRRMVGFARALATDPEIAVYDRLADGLHAEERDALLRTALAFHGERPGRVTIFLSARPMPAAERDTMVTVHLTKGRFA